MLVLLTMLVAAAQDARRLDYLLAEAIAPSGCHGSGWALRELALAEHPAAVPLLVDALDDREGFYIAVEGLERYGGPGRIRLVEVMLDHVAGDDLDRAVRAHAVLARLDYDRAVHLDALAALLEDGHCCVAWEIRRVGPPAAARLGPVLHQVARDSGGAPSQMGVLVVLGDLGYAPAIPDLIAWLDHDDPKVQRNAAWALRYFGAAAEAALPKLDHERSRRELVQQRAPLRRRRPRHPRGRGHELPHGDDVHRHPDQPRPGDAVGLD